MTPTARPRVRRRWLALGTLILLTLLALAAWFGRDNIFREIIKPTIPFQVFEPPAAPDYSRPEAWAARPTGAALTTGTADVFFIHPTTDENGKAGWNAAINEPEALSRLGRVVLPNHARPFQALGPLWVPLYRQATLFALLSHREDSRDALAFAYTDVSRAFDAFLAARTPGRPFVLVGIGQGGLHLQRLLARKVVGTPLMGELAAAYVIDQAAPLAQFETGGALARLPLCAAPGQPGCVVAFATVTAGDTRGMRQLRERSLVWGADGAVEGLAGRPVACVNPLTGALGQPDAKPRLNRGAAAASHLEPDAEPALLPGATGARCVDGALIVEVHRPAVLEPPFWAMGTRYKTPAYNLFYANLGADAAARVAALTPT